MSIAGIGPNVIAANRCEAGLPNILDILDPDLATSVKTWPMPSRPGSCRRSHGVAFDARAQSDITGLGNLGETE
jgi:hypothetical protein